MGMLRGPLTSLCLVILSACAGSPDAIVPAASVDKLPGGVLTDVTDRRWAEAGMGAGRLQQLYRASAVDVQLAQASEFMTGIAIDAYHVVMKCPPKTSGLRVSRPARVTAVRARLLAKGPDDLCVLRTDAEMEGALPLALNTDAQVGTVVHSRSNSPEGESWISTPIEEIIVSEKGKRLRVPARHEGSAVQPLFDEQSRIVGLLSDMTPGNTVATGMDWLVPVLMRPRPCLPEEDYAVDSASGGEWPNANAPGSSNDIGPEIVAAMRAFGVMLSERFGRLRNPGWYPAGAYARGLEGTRKAIMKFRSGRLESIEIEGAETDLLAMGVRQLLDCIAVPEVPHGLHGVAFRITLPFVFQMPEGGPAGSDPAQIGDEDRS